jgi:hypothetical protein
MNTLSVFGWLGIALGVLGAPDVTRIALKNSSMTDGTDPGTGAQPKSVARPKPQGPPKAKHSCDPAEGFYPDYPQAWRQIVEGQLKRAKEGNVLLIFLGDSLVQGWSEQPR